MNPQLFRTDILRFGDSMSKMCRLILIRNDLFDILLKRLINNDLVKKLYILENYFNDENLAKRSCIGVDLRPCYV